MSCQVLRTLLNVDSIIGECATQAVIKNPLDVPDIKPRIERVLSVTATVADYTTNVVPNKVIIDGNLDVGVLYVGFTPSTVSPYEAPQAVHFFEATVPFTAFAEVPGALPGMTATVTPTVEFVNFNQVDVDTVQVEIVLRLVVRVTQSQTVNICTDIRGPLGLNVIRELMTLDVVIAENKGQTVVQGPLNVPPEKPSIERILNVNATITDLVAETLPGQVSVTGTLAVDVLYVASGPILASPYSQPVHFFEGTLPFTLMIPCVGVTPEMTAMVDAKIEYTNFHPIAPNTPGGEMRALSVEAVVRARVKITDMRQVQMVTDCTGIVGLQMQRFLLRCDQVIGRDHTQVVLRNQLDVPAAKPAIERVLSVTSRLLNYTATVIPDKVIVEGQIELGIMYVAAPGPDVYTPQPVHFFEQTVGFTAFVDIPCALPGMNVTTVVLIEYTNSRLIGTPGVGGTRTVQVELVAKVLAKVTATRECSIVVDMTCPANIPFPSSCPPGTQMPSLTVYIVQPGDTLFLIAQRFGTTVEQILQFNKIANPNVIIAGTQLFIPKTILCAPTVPNMPTMPGGGFLSAPKG